MPCPSPAIDFAHLRACMVEQQLQARGITDGAVLRTMRTVPREIFVPDALRHAAYRDAPLPIGSGQTISQPSIVALMTELLRLGPEDRVLEIGTGSGYQAPFDASIVTSAAPGIAEPQQSQLSDGGRLAVPAGSSYCQTLYRIERHGADFSVTEHGGCVFVPLIGRRGWNEKGWLPRSPRTA